MKTFDDLENDAAKLPVELDQQDGTGFGTLYLKGRESDLILSLNKHLDHENSEHSGWFDVALKSTFGQSILIRDAVQMGMRFLHSDDIKFEYTIFPNIVIFNSDKLGKDKLVKWAQFTFNLSEYFFYYKSVDYLYSLSDDERFVLKSSFLKNKENKAPHFRPSAIYITHNLPRILRFRVDSRTYEVNSFSRMNFPLSSINYSCGYYFSIRFDDPVSINHALQMIWEWRAYFSQCAFDSLFFTSISASSGPIRDGHANFYLPNIQRVQKEKHRGRDLHPSNAPLNQWHERAELSSAMKTWLEKADIRRQFRSSLEIVISHINDRFEIGDIVTLCSGIDSLSDFDDEKRFLKGEIESLVLSCYTTAVENNIDISKDRLRGLLSTLSSSSLPRKLKGLGKSISSFVDSGDFGLLIDAVLELRRHAAHGHAPADPRLPKLLPAIRALASACIIWDLGTSGALKPNSEGVIPAVSHFKHAIADLKAISNR